MVISYHPPPTSIKSLNTKCWGFFVSDRYQLAELRDETKKYPTAEGSRDFIEGSPHTGSPKVIRHRPLKASDNQRLLY